MFRYLNNSTEGRDDIDVDASEVKEMGTRRGRSCFQMTFAYEINYDINKKYFCKFFNLNKFYSSDLVPFFNFTFIFNYSLILTHPPLLP